MKKTTSTGTILGRIGCALLAALMLAGLFLPSLKTPSPSDYLTDVYGEISGTYMDSSDRIVCAVIGDAFDNGTAEQVFHRFSKLTQADLGSTDGLSYGFADADQALKDIQLQIGNDFYSQMDDLEWSLRNEDVRSARAQFSRLLSREHFRDLFARLMYATLISNVNRAADYAGARVNVKDTMRQVQGIAGYLGKAEVTPLAMSMISLRLALLSTQTETVRVLVDPSAGNSEMDTLMLIVRIVGFVILGLHVLFAAMVICALVGSILGKRKLVKVTGIIATVLAVLALALVLLVRWLAPVIAPKLGLSSSVENILSNGAVFPTPTIWMIAVAVAGILICVITNHLWKRGAKEAPVQAPADPVAPVVPEVPVAPAAPVSPAADEGSWVCSCGAVCDAGARFCTTCGAKRPEPAPKNTWTCECGSTWDESVRFCVNCGRKQPEEQQAEQQPEEQPVCAVCGAPLNPGQNFCLKCGSPVHAVHQD